MGNSAITIFPGGRPSAPYRHAESHQFTRCIQAEEVFDFVADERNEPRYNPKMRLAEKISDGPIGLGTRFRAQTVSMGRPVDMVHRGHRLPATASARDNHTHVLDGSARLVDVRPGSGWNPDAMVLGFTAGRHAQDAELACRQHGPAPGTDHLDWPQGSPGSTDELKENGPGAPHPSGARTSDRSAQPRWPCLPGRLWWPPGRAGAADLGQQEQGISAGHGCKTTMQTTSTLA